MVLATARTYERRREARRATLSDSWRSPAEGRAGVKLAWLFALVLVAGAGTVPHADAQAPLPLVAILCPPPRAAERGARSRELGRIIPHLFRHLRGKLKGRRRLDYRKAWASACKKTGVSGDFGTTSGGQQCGTWSTRGWPSGSP